MESVTKGNLSYENFPVLEQTLSIKVRGFTSDTGISMSSPRLPRLLVLSPVMLDPGGSAGTLLVLLNGLLLLLLQLAITPPAISPYDNLYTRY